VNDSIVRAGRLAALALILAVAPARAAEQIHWTIMGPRAVSFDWVGVENTIEYGLTPALGASTRAYTPSPLPWDMAGPFKEARLTELVPDTLYYWRIGSDPIHTFRTPRAPGRSDFTVYAEGDIGSTRNFWRMGVVQQQIADGHPAFVLGLGDITYANSKGFEVIRQHFNDVMVWSRDAAYMTVWGNHEWDGGDYDDDLRNYKGRFDFPNPQTAPSVPASSCCGEDWYWFDYGNVRFIAYPELMVGAFADWHAKAGPLMAAAQADPNITFIVTFGHRPAYSSGRHPGSPSLKEFMDDLGSRYSKFRLNLNGHSHNYERTYPQSGVVHVTAGGGGSHLSEEDGSCLWRGGCPAPEWSAFRAMRHGPVRLEFSADQIVVEAVCGPPGDTESNINDLECDPGTVFDRVVIRVTTPDGAIDAPSGDVTIAPGAAVTFAASGVEPDGHFPLTYHWDFGGGAANRIVEDPGPVTFANPGVYLVRMTVVDATGVADPTPATRTITVGSPNLPPDGEIVEPAADRTIQVGETVTFMGVGHDPEHEEPLHYFWDFEGGAAKTSEQNPGAVTFQREGTFEVSLTVHDPRGAFDPTPAFRTITVLAGNQAPVAEILAPSGDDTVDVGEPVNFQGQATDPDGHAPLSYRWRFGGGVPDQLVEDPGFLTLEPGTYVVRFEVTDALGLRSSTPPTRTIVVRVPNAQPVAALSLSAITGNAPLDVVVDAGASTDPDGTIASYTYDFGDGVVLGPVNDSKVPHRYRTGSWTATVTVTDDRGGTHTTSQPVLVAPGYPGTNEVDNASVETSLSGWTAYNGATIARVADGFDGAWGIEVRGPAAIQTYGVQDSPNWLLDVPAGHVGVPYTFRAWVRSASHTGRVRLQVREFNGGVKVGQTALTPYHTLSPEWQMLELAHAAQQAHSTLDFHVLGTPTVPGEAFVVDNVSIHWNGATTGVDDLLTEGAALAAYAVPNPMRLRGAIAFRLPAPGPVRVEVLDVNGRLVRTLLDLPMLGSGVHQASFDGRDRAGRPVVSGIYFYRVEWGVIRTTRRFAFVR
jgi:PKD repeat protein